jgi:hypothetical protein
MGLSADLSNSANWELVSNQFFQPIPTSGANPNTIYPIYEFPISPILFENPLVAIYAKSPSAPPHWQFAGLLIQRVAVGLVIGGLNEAIQETKAVRLNTIQVFNLPQYTSTYQLNFRVARWLRDIELNVWRYIGSQSDSTENMIQGLEQDLARIEFKIDNLPH